MFPQRQAVTNNGEDPANVITGVEGRAPATAPPQGPGPLITGVQQTDVSQAFDPIHPDALPA